MQKHFRILLVTVVTVASGFGAVSQTEMYKAVILDGKPSRLNLKTGVITTINDTVAKAYSAFKTLDSIKSSSLKDNKKSSILLDTSTTIAQPIVSLSVDDAKKINTSGDADVDFHTVLEGETLYGISKQYKVSLNALKKANNLQTTIIRVGQNLRVGSLHNLNQNISVFWVVTRGDTLYSIAQENNTTVNRIKSLNGLKSNQIVVGQKLQIQ